MRIQAAIFIGILSLALGGCAQTDTRESDRKVEDRTETPARKAGSTAYKIAEETKAAAKKAARELKDAGRDVREGWNDAKHDEKAKGK